ncbi:MAG: extracellular solute-binding protein [Spirochaetia bacterium]|nr:extracellular solute-binding protein [Spirochaetia bacterium]
MAAQYRQKAVVIELSLYSGNSWGVPQNFAYAVYDRAAEMFESAYAEKNYHIVLKTGKMYKDYSEWFAQLVLTGREPDVFLILEEDFNTYASIGLLENLDPYIAKSEVFSAETLFPIALEAGRYRAKQYSLPISMVPSFLIVNKTLFEELGLQLDLENWTWEQFYMHCAALTADTDDDGELDRFGVEGYDWHQAFYTNGMELFDPAGASAGFDDDRMIEMLEFLKKIYDLNKGYVVRDGDFEKGRAGFKTFNVSEYRVYGSFPYKLLRYDDFEWEAIPFPSGPQGASTSKLYTVQIGMSSRSSHKKAAFSFLELIAGSDEFQHKIWEETNTLPVNRFVIESLYTDEKVQQDGVKLLDKGFLENILTASYIDPDFKNYSYIDDIVTQRIFKIIAQDEDPGEGVKDLKDDIRESLTYIR